MALQSRFLLLAHLMVLLPDTRGISVSLSPSSSSSLPSPKFVVLGGTGKIGSAVAAHLLRRKPDCEVVLVGRRQNVKDEAIGYVRRQVPYGGNGNDNGGGDLLKLSFELVEDVWDPKQLERVLKEDVSAVIHTAGPYAEKNPTVLDAVIEARIPVYVDVSDPLPFLDDSLERFRDAVKSGTTALCASGAFPGMSNVLGMEAAQAALWNDPDNSSIQDLRFNYFTKGLGGSGTVNLYITNLGFGDPMTQFDQGRQYGFKELSGKLLGEVDFFLDNDYSDLKDETKDRVGTELVFAWPFPEAATVARELNIKGSSSAAMGTAPAIWNWMLGLLVDIVPRPWWRSKPFSKFMADFSQPLVLLTDAILQKTTPDQVGETHAMRIDATTESGRRVSIVQAHESFRQCVGQSCAEFALDALEYPSPGVYFPEQRYRRQDDRSRIIDKLTSTPGTFAYTGPIRTGGNQGSNQHKEFPTNVDQVVEKAREEELAEV